MWRGPVRVLAKAALRAFWTSHQDAETPLLSWYNAVEKARWSNLAELRALYRTADPVGKFTVFNIGGNKYRLVTFINYESHHVFIRAVLTHAEYDTGKWKLDAFE